MTSQGDGRGVSRRKFVGGALAGGAALAIGQVPGGARAQGSPLVLRAISSWEKTISFSKPLLDLIDRVNRNSAGRLRIDWIGGPEAVPIFQGADAVSKGVFDMVLSSPPFFASSIPESNALFLRDDLTVPGLYKSGIVKALDEISRERIGVAFIGVPASGFGFTFFMRQQPQNLDSFKGKKIRTTPLYTPILRALGASTVTIAPAEVYPALERGVVDGVAWPASGILERKFHEVAKYMVLPTYYDVRLALLMNARAYDRMPADLRKVLLDSIRETEEWGAKLFKQESASEIAEVQRLGVVVVTLSPAEGKKFLKMADDALWEQVVKDSPKHGLRLKELFAKAKN